VVFEKAGIGVVGETFMIVLHVTKFLLHLMKMTCDILQTRSHEQPLFTFRKMVKILGEDQEMLHSLDGSLWWTVFDQMSKIFQGCAECMLLMASACNATQA
jgi:hypothetical protein